jgi:hypothetical protein
MNDVSTISLNFDDNSQPNILTHCAVRSNYALKTLSTMAIDGKADESAWSATPIDTFGQRGLAPATLARLRLLHDDASLFVFYSVDDPTPIDINQTLLASNGFGASFGADSAEFYLHRAAGGGGIQHSLMTWNAGRFTAGGGGGNQNSAGSCVGMRVDGGWQVEASIPLASLNGTGPTLTAMFAFNDQSMNAGLAQVGEYNSYCVVFYCYL